MKEYFGNTIIAFLFSVLFAISAAFIFGFVGTVIFMFKDNALETQSIWNYLSGIPLFVLYRSGMAALIYIYVCYISITFLLIAMLIYKLISLYNDVYLKPIFFFTLSLFFCLSAYYIYCYFSQFNDDTQLAFAIFTLFVGLHAGFFYIRKYTRT